MNLFYFQTMISMDKLRALATSFPEVKDAPHFEKISFRVKKKIFITVDEKEHVATVKLSEIDQEVFTSTSHGAIYPVPNKWGKQGWTRIELQEVNRDLCVDVVTTAYCEVAPKTLAEQVRPPSND